MHKNLIAGLIFGAALGAGVISILVFAALLQLGARHLWNESPAFALYALPLGALIAAWGVGCLFAGLIFGWFLPYEGGFLRAMGICILMATPPVLCVRIAFEGIGGWTLAGMFEAALRAGVFGLSAGFVLWTAWLGGRRNHADRPSVPTTSASSTFRIRWHS